MKLYRINVAVTFGPGQTLFLDDRQATDRPLEVLKKGPRRSLVRMTALSQFKAGEVLGFDGPVPKFLAADAELIEAARADA